MTATDATANDTASSWVSVAAVASHFGIGPRAVQKRCEKGQLKARRVEVPGGVRWEIDGREIEGANQRTGTRTDNTLVRELAGQGREPEEKHAGEAANQPTNQGANRRNEVREPTNQEADLRAQLEREREEVRFLRGIIESDRRDMAELRAALRKALEIAPRQLAAPVAEDGQGISGNAAKPANSAPMNTHTPEGQSARNSGTEREESAPSTYGELADMLERQLGGMN